MKKFFAYAGIFMYFCFFGMLAMARTSYCYIDPATTSYVIQIIAGVFIALGAVVGIFWRKIRLFFRNIKLKGLEKKLSREAEKRENNK